MKKVKVMIYETLLGNIKSVDIEKWNKWEDEHNTSAKGKYEIEYFEGTEEELKEIIKLIKKG